MFKINKSKIDHRELEERLTNGAAGALATFSGWVRNHNEGHSVLSLEYEAYEALAEKEAANIIAEAKSKFAIIEAVCEHRVGVLAIGDMAVFVGVTAAHRGAAFDACRYIIDEIKLRLPIWKKETYQSGETGWVNCGMHEAHRHSVSGTAPIIDEREFYSRQNRLPEFHGGRQKNLSDARVLVIGAGGLGCPALQHLAGAGVGTLTICDDDNVSVDNLHRQNLFNINDIGKNKAEVACQKLTLINPFIKIKAINERLTADNASKILSNHDVVLDCTDNLKAKFILAEACRKQTITLLQASIYQYEGQLLLFKNGVSNSGQCFNCLWPENANLELNGDDCIDNCAEAGVIGAVAGVIGSMQAFECIKLLLGMGSTLNTHVVLFDLLTLQITQLKAKRNQDCKHCSKRGSEPPHVNSEQPHVFVSNHIDLPLEIQVENFEQLKQSSKIVIVDIREEGEQNDESTKSISHLIEILKARAELNDDNSVKLVSTPLSYFDPATVTLDQAASVQHVLLCQSGSRSLKLARQLRQKGFANVFSLKGGLKNLAREIRLKV